MPDNIGVKPNTTTCSVQVATDEINEIHYPIYKIAYGEDGEAELVNADAPLPIESAQLLLEIRETHHLLGHMLIQLKLQTEMMKEAFNSTLTERDIS
jgi:hypothetical protein